MGTHERLIAAAAALLDAGGEAAVTLRAVAQAVGVSHNAPYKHFEDRSALLAAVAIVDFRWLTGQFEAIASRAAVPETKLQDALGLFIRYGREFPARYKLLFGDPAIGALGGELEAAALQSFAAFASIVEACQNSGTLPKIATTSLSGLIYASVHGMIDLEASKRMREENGLSDVFDGAMLLLNLISVKASPSAV